MQVTDVRALQPKKAPACILVRPAGSTTVVRLLQPLNTPGSTTFTLSGIVTDSNPLQPSKAKPPIKVTLDGNETVFISLQLLNVELSIIVTPSGIMTDVGSS